MNAEQQEVVDLILPHLKELHARLLMFEGTLTFMLANEMVWRGREDARLIKAQFLAFYKLTVRFPGSFTPSSEQLEAEIHLASIQMGVDFIANVSKTEDAIWAIKNKVSGDSPGNSRQPDRPAT